MLAQGRGGQHRGAALAGQASSCRASLAGVSGVTGPCSPHNPGCPQPGTSPLLLPGELLGGLGPGHREVTTDDRVQGRLIAVGPASPAASSPAPF